MFTSKLPLTAPISRDSLVSHQLSVCLRGRVEHVDEDEAKSHQQHYPGGHDVGRDEERHLDIGDFNISNGVGEIDLFFSNVFLFSMDPVKVEAKFNLKLAGVGGCINIYFEIHYSPFRKVYTDILLFHQ